MYTPSEKCPTREKCVQNGKGILKFKDLATQESMYNHVKIFSTITLEPGQSIGYHCHDQETEWYYVIRGEGLFNDNNVKKIQVHPGDVCATGNGESHSIENNGTETLELVALIVLNN